MKDKWHSDEYAIPGSQENWSSLQDMAYLSRCSMHGVQRFWVSSHPCLKDHALQHGPYGEKTLHLGLAQLVNSILGAQSNRDISVNTQSWSANHSARSHICSHSPKCLWDTLQLTHPGPTALSWSWCFAKNSPVSFFKELGSHSVAPAGMHWCNGDSLQPWMRGAQPLLNAGQPLGSSEETITIANMQPRLIQLFTECSLHAMFWGWEFKLWS